MYKNYDTHGNVLKQTDSTGLKKTMNLWGNNLDELYEVVYPNNSRLHYNYENGKVTSISTGTGALDKISYAVGEVTKLSCNQSSLSFGYDGKRRLAKVNIDGSNSDHYSLSYPNQNTVKVTNANGESYTYEEDSAHTYSKVYYGSTLELQTDYFYDGKIKEQTDNLCGETVNYSYSQVNKIQQYRVIKNRTLLYSANFAYDIQGRISSISQSGTTSIPYRYTYEDGLDGKLNKITVGNNSIEIKYDELGRYTGREVSCGSNVILKEEISYKEVREDVYLVSDTRRVNRQSTLPWGIKYSSEDKIGYFYDDSGNIEEINKNSLHMKYTYDSADRLIREDNQEIGKSYFYTYDNNGNITQKKTCAYTTEEYTTGTVINYTYDKDKLLSYNGESCVYDSIGNPTIYRGKSATWKGRQLQSFNGVTFSYDGRGQKNSKEGNKVLLRL